MDVQGYSIPEDLLYTREHEWVREVGSAVRIGITDYAAKTLNDVVYVMSPKAGQAVAQSKPMGSVESIKAVSDVFSPVSGTVTSVNTQLDSHPELINKSPYGDGWLVEVKPSNFPSDKRALLDPKAYAAHLNELLKA
jgi:glycine cleavage system H protein